MNKLTQLILSLSLPVCFSTSAQTLEIPGKDGPGKGKKIVLISGDEEYRSEEALPMLAKILSQHHGFDCTVLFSVDPEGGWIDANNQKSLPGMAALNDADLAIIFTRFRTPPEDEMKHLETYLQAGKPVIGLRTATHGFRGKWSWIGLDVVGEKWVAHHGGHKREGCRGVIEEANKDHEVLNGVSDVFAPSDVYTVRNLDERKATVLLRGAVTETLDPRSKPVEGKKNEPMQALAWLRDYETPTGGKGKAFGTTMGASVDLVSEDARRIIVNAALHLVGLDVPEKANVDYIDPYYPSFFGFFRDKEQWKKRNLKPEDFGLGKAPLPFDPPGTPNWPFRETGPKKKAE